MFAIESSRGAFINRLPLTRVLLFGLPIVACASIGCGDGEGRDHSVSVKTTIPANPTQPIVIQTDDPESQVEVTLPVDALQELVQAAGGGPVEVTMTDMAPQDYDSLPSDERALVEAVPSLVTLVFDVRAASGLRASTLSRSALRGAQMPRNNSTQFSVRNNTGRRCTPGVVDFFQIFGTNSTRPESTIVIDDASPFQNITGFANVSYEVLHFIFCWECPRVTPTGSSGGT